MSSSRVSVSSSHTLRTSTSSEGATPNSKLSFHTGVTTRLSVRVRTVVGSDAADATPVGTTTDTVTNGSARP